MNSGFNMCDLMTDKVKDFKQHIDPPPETATSSDTVQTTFPGSKVHLYRYGRFALHSLLKKYYKDTQKPCTKDILTT